MSPCLFLVRHAQSANNAKAEDQRIPDPPITPLGETQSQRLATALSALQPTHLFTSPFLRSIQTTRAAANLLRLQPTIHRELFEQGGCYRGHAVGDRHPMPGMGRSQLQALCPNWTIDPLIPETGWNTLSEYEEIDQARERARRVAAWLSSQTHRSEERWALIIHADFKLRILEALLDRNDLEEHLGDVINTSISRLSWNQGRWRLDFWNSYQHLVPELVTA
jgi:2,3-bisphosphoglycerate-dependent phosphoglycerate mutase